MVANQSGVNMILSFGAKSVNPEILEKLLIGRQKAADFLHNAAKSIAEDGNNQHIMVVGQRGMGKTHLLRVLFHRMQPLIKDKKIVVAYFSEEEYGIASYFDFLVRILNSFLKWYDEDREMIKSRIADLQNTPISAQPTKAEEIIEEFCSARPLLILAENFSDILAALNTSNEQGRLRSWLYTSDRISIIATSQALSNNFDKESRPFFGFFTNYYLKNLTFPESLEFLIQLSILDNKEDVTDFLRHKGRPQIKALYDMVKGNHRLLVTFYEFLKTDTLAKLSTHFIKTINDLKPYYESFIRYLPPQQQKILRYIALSRKPQNGVEICKNCFIEQRTFSKQISELTRKRLIEAITDPTDGRNKLYDINEPLLRISIEVGEHREGVTVLFVDFLAIFYTQEELSERKARFIQRQQACANEQDLRTLDYEIFALEKAIELKKSDNNRFLETEVRQKIKLLDNQAQKHLENQDYKECIKVIQQILELNPDDAVSLSNYGLALFSLALTENNELLYHEAIEKYKESILLNPEDKTVFNNYGVCLAELARIKNDDSLFLESFEKFQQAINYEQNYAMAHYNWGTALGIYASIKNDRILYNESIEKLKQALITYTQDDQVFNNLGASISDLAIIDNNKELILEGIRYFQKSIEIKAGNHNAYKNWGDNLFHLFLFEKDINLLFQSIEKFKISFDISHDISCLERVNKSIIEILKSSLENNLINLDIIRDFTTTYMPQFPEFKITKKYIDVYQKYVVEGDKKALYSLPKEQREFFKKEILGEE